MRRTQERGSSMVEFAIAATALLLLLMGLVEFGRAMYMYHVVSNAARIGSRWALVRGSVSCGDTYPIDHCNATPAQIQTQVQGQVPLTDSGTLSVATAWSSAPLETGGSCPSPPSPAPGSAAGGANAPGHLVCVTVTYPFKFAVPFVSKSTLNLSSTSQMAISQ